MNINYGDTGYVVKYIQTFLRDNYNSTMLISGVYDEYTHQMLIDYVQKGFVSDILTDVFTTFNEDLFSLYFTIERANNNIRLISKEKGTDNTIAQLMTNYYTDIALQADNNGWRLEYYNYDVNEERYIINITPKKMNRKLPQECSLLLNHFNNIYLDKHIDSNDIIVDNDYNNNDKMLALIPWVENLSITFMHRYENAIDVKMGLTQYNISNLNNTSLEAIETVSAMEPTTAQTISAYNYINSIDFAIPKYFIVEVDKIEAEDANKSFINNIFIHPNTSQANLSVARRVWYENFGDDPWMVHSKLLDYIFDRTISDLNNSEDIIYLQELINLYYNKTMFSVDGEFTSTMKTAIRNYQSAKGIKFGFGYLDVETEANLLKDIKAIGG